MPDPHQPEQGQPEPGQPDPARPDTGAPGTEVTADAAPTRRERLRRETLAELEAAALADVREHGAVALSLRRVARRMGMSPAGLYRYVDSRDGLLTLLISRAFDDLADHLLAAIGGDDGHPRAGDRGTPQPPVVAPPGSDVADRLAAVALAYQAWSVAHPNEFALVFGDPIPGYVAPPGGPTVVAMTRVGSALATPLVEAWRSGRLRVHPALRDPALEGPLEPMAGLAADLPPAVRALLLTAWGRLHGQVALEVFGQHHWLFPDGCEVLFRAEVAAMLTDLGLTTPP